MAAPGVYVYAFVRAGHPLPADVRGVGDTKAPVRLLPCGELAAVIGPVPETLRARRRDLMAHQRLLSDLVPGGPVLPMRFGAIAPGETAVLDGAKARSAEYLAALESVEGRLEMNLKVMPAEDSLSDLVREDPAYGSCARRCAAVRDTRSMCASAKLSWPGCDAGPRTPPNRSRPRSPLSRPSRRRDRTSRAAYAMCPSLSRAGTCPGSTAASTGSPPNTGRRPLSG